MPPMMQDFCKGTLARMSPEQGEIWDVNFAEGFLRPGIVVTRNELKKGRLVLVVPCTSSAVEDRARHPNNVELPAGAGGLSKRSVAQTHLIQPVDLDWFILRWGKLDEEDLGRVLQALAWSVDLFPA